VEIHTSLLLPSPTPEPVPCERSSRPFRRPASRRRAKWSPTDSPFRRWSASPSRRVWLSCPTCFRPDSRPNGNSNSNRFTVAPGPVCRCRRARWDNRILNVHLEDAKFSAEPVRLGPRSFVVAGPRGVFPANSQQQPSMLADLGSARFVLLGAVCAACSDRLHCLRPAGAAGCTSEK